MVLLAAVIAVALIVRNYRKLPLDKLPNTKVSLATSVDDGLAMENVADNIYYVDNNGNVNEPFTDNELAITNYSRVV